MNVEEIIQHIRVIVEGGKSPLCVLSRNICDAYEALLAEYERVRAEKVTMALDFCAITEKAKAAIAEAEALEKDAARYHTLAGTNESVDYDDMCENCGMPLPGGCGGQFAEETACHFIPMKVQP